MKFELPGLHGYKSTLVESVCEQDTVLMGIIGRAYYCLTTRDPDIFNVLKLKIKEARHSIDRIKFAEGVVIHSDGKWMVIKNRFGECGTDVTITPVGHVPTPTIKTTKAFLFEILVIDHDGYGIENAKINIRQAKYLNATILSSKTADIGEWDDDHPLNYSNVSRKTVMSYFETSNG